VQFGPVLDVVAKKAGGMKEQGFVVFRDVMTAATAMRSLQVCLCALAHNLEHKSPACAPLNHQRNLVAGLQISRQSHENYLRTWDI
jgi:hypothetical protein